MTQKDLNLTLSSAMNAAIEAARQAAAVRAFIDQELLDLGPARDDIVRLINILMIISSDIVRLVDQLNNLGTTDVELPSQAKHLLADLHAEIELCKTMLENSPDIFTDAA